MTHSQAELEDKACRMFDEIIQEINECQQVIRLINKRKPHVSMEQRIMLSGAEAMLTDMHIEARKLKEEMLDIGNKVRKSTAENDIEYFLIILSKMGSWFSAASTIRERNHNRIAEFMKHMDEMFGKE